MKMVKNSAVKMNKAPAKFNDKLEKASEQGKLSGEFKKAVDNAPTKMYGKKSPARKYSKSPMREDKVTYSEAYNKLKPTKSGGRYDEKNKKNYNSEAEFTTAAKAYNDEKNTPKKIETKKVTKVEVKTAKPTLQKVKVNEKAMENKKTLGDTKLGNVKVGKNGKRLADTKIGKAFSKGRAKGVAARQARIERMAAAKAERIAKRNARKNKK